MEDFTTNNPDSLDGDFKALLAMRRTRQSLMTEQEEKERLLIEKTMQKFIDNKNKKVTAQVSEVTVVSKEVERGDIDYDKIRNEAFQYVDDGNANSLKTTIQNVMKRKGDIDQLHQPKTTETLLHRALSKGSVNMNVVTLLVQSFSDKQICTSQQLTVGGKKSMLTVLHMATEKGHVAAVKLIVTSICDKDVRAKLLYKTTVIVPEGQRPRPLTCLHMAAKGGNNGLVTYFIEECAMPVDLANDKGDLPILWAANDNRPLTVQLLIKLGANVNGQNDKGSSALHWACRNGHTEVVKILLSESKDINVNIERRLGLVCPIIAASAMGFTEIVRLLIGRNADVNKTMKSGHTALHFAAVEGCLDIVMLLLDAGAAINARDDQGNNALLLAASHGQHLVVVFLAKVGSNFHQKNNAGKGVWDYALEQKNAKLMMALVDHVANNMTTDGTAVANDQGNSIPQWPALPAKSSTSQKLVLPPGITPLHAAATIGDNEIIQFLIDMNIDPFGTDDDESTFIHVAARHNQWETLQKYATEQLCRTQDYRGYTALHIACEHACNEAIAIILPLSNLSQTNSHKQTALHLAARSTSVSGKNTKVLVTQMILHHDWTVVHVQDANERSALHSAVLAGNIQIIPELNHLSPNIADANGCTPVHIAIMNGDHEMLDQLIATFAVVGKSIDLNKKDSSGNTPLHLAARHCHEKMIETLITAGADLEKVNSRGRSVLHELALLISEKRADELSYMEVFYAIRDTCIHWWCQQNRKSVPSALADDSIEYKKKAVLHLFTGVHDEDGLNVLQYAAKQAATEMIIAILNTPHVFRFTTQQSTVQYDISDLLPFTSTHEQRIDNKKSSKHNYSSVTPDDRESNPQVYIASEKANSVSIAELLVKVDAHEAVASVLDTSPFKNIVDSYWGAYQKLFAIAFLLHVLVMAIYSYSGIDALGCSSNNTATLSGTADSYVRSWQSELGLAISLVWPICLLIYDMVKMVKLSIKCCRVGGYRIVKSLRSESEYRFGSLILQLCGFFYSTLTICWYIMNRYCHVHQDYVLALSYIFGWVYAIDFTRGFKQVHHFSIILQHILFRDMLRFGLIYLFILLAFSFAYTALVHAVPSSAISSSSSIFLVFNWMIGMDDFQTESDDFDAANKNDSVVKIVYSAYIILSTIVLLNLLIAMMSDSYANVRKMSEVMWTIGSLRLPLEFEEGLGRSYYRPKHLHFDVDASRWYIQIAKKDLVERESSSDAVIHDLTMKVEKLMEESRVRESRVLAILQSKDATEVANDSEK